MKFHFLEQVECCRDILHNVAPMIIRRGPTPRRNLFRSLSMMMQIAGKWAWTLQ